MSNQSAVVWGVSVTLKHWNLLCLFYFFCLCTSMFGWIRINRDYVHEICYNSSLQWGIKKFFLEFKWGLTQTLILYWRVCPLLGTRIQQVRKTYCDYFLLYCKCKCVPNSWSSTKVIFYWMMLALIHFTLHELYDRNHLDSLINF